MNSIPAFLIITWTKFPRCLRVLLYGPNSRAACYYMDSIPALRIITWTQFQNYILYELKARIKYYYMISISASYNMNYIPTLYIVLLCELNSRVILVYYQSN
jgi:hypothetical protein